MRWCLSSLTSKTCQTQCQRPRSRRSLDCTICGIANGSSNPHAQRLVMVSTKALIGCLVHFPARSEHNAIHVGFGIAEFWSIIWFQTLSQCVRLAIGGLDMPMHEARQAQH